MTATQKMKAVRGGNWGGSEADSSRRWWIWIGLFVALWIAEWTWIQALTIPARPITRHPLFIPTIRACFNGLSAVVLVLLVPRLWGLVIINITAGICAIGLIAYSQYFKSPLANLESIRLLFGTTGRAIPFAVSSEPLIILGGLLVAGVIKIYLLWKAQPFSPDWKLRRRGIGLAVAAWILLILGLQRTTYSFQRMAVQPFSRSIYAYGYLTSWSHRAFLPANNQTLLNRANAEFAHDTDQAIVRLEERRIIGSPLVILQVESLGFEVLDQHVARGEVVPFINLLKEKSLLYRIRAYHYNGSGDMDFTCLAGGHPSFDIMNYRLAEFEYTNSLPLFLKRHGYQTTAYHGNTGDFFNRRTAFLKMGFDHLGFKEDLTHLKLPSNYWGIRDQALLMRVATEMSGATGRYFAFVITLDSHVPWDLIRPEEALLFPGSRDITERYLNSIHWVDRALQQFYEAIPEGTTLLIYGDHTAHAKGGSAADRSFSAEYVPALLLRKGENWSKTQRNRDWSLRTDELTLLDVMAYVRTCIDHEETRMESSE